MRLFQLIGATLFIAIFKIFEFLLPETPELTYLFIIPLILIIGIPHGATDHILDNVVKHNHVSAKITLPFLINYLTPMVVFGLMWWLFPIISLLVFIIISAIHFGETQWENSEQNQKSGNRGWRNVMQYSWGLALLSGLFFMYPEDFNYFTLSLTQNTSVELTTLIFGFLLVISLCIWILIALIIDKKNLLKQLFEFALLILLFSISGLLIGFTVFFVFWHSIDAINLQLSLIKKMIPSFDLKGFMKVAWPVSLISVLGIGLLLLTVHFFDLPLPTLLFIMISIITLPHHFSVEKFYAFARAKS